MVKGCLSARISSRAVRDRNIDRLLAYLGCHDMGGVPMTAWLLMAWRWIASSRIAQGTMFVAGLIGYHLLRIRMAERSGRKDGRQGEQDRIRHEQEQRRKEITDEAQEIDREHSDLDRDDLRERMRNSATDSDRR